MCEEMKGPSFQVEWTSLLVFGTLPRFHIRQLYGLKYSQIFLSLHFHCYTQSVANHGKICSACLVPGIYKIICLLNEVSNCRKNELVQNQHTTISLFPVLRKYHIPFVHTIILLYKYFFNIDVSHIIFRRMMT